MDDVDDVGVLDFYPSEGSTRPFSAPWYEYHGAGIQYPQHISKTKPRKFVRASPRDIFTPTFTYSRVRVPIRTSDLRSSRSAACVW